MSKFVLKSIECELGVSIEINKVWYRLGTKMASDCTQPATLSELKEQYDRCWKVIEEEIGSQVEELQK